MGEHKVRILHLSDLHERQGPAGDAKSAAKRGGEPWRRRQVLGDAWKKNLDEIAEAGAIDLVCFTGDVADWGLAEEYAAVTDFVLETLGRLGVPLKRFFVVPGNHDIHRPTNDKAWESLRKDLFLRRPGDALDKLVFSRWIAGLEEAPRGMDAALVDQALARSAEYRRWLDERLGRKDLLPEASPHGRLGYRKTIRLPGRPFDLHVAGLDTAWLSGSMNSADFDAGKLLLTENQVGKLTTGDDGTALGGLRIALMHHPLSDLADGAEARVLLANHVDLILRGHLHEESLEEWVEPARKLRMLAAGSLYEGDLGDRWPNAFHVVEITTDGAGRPLGYAVRFRTWSTRRLFWFDDNGQYSGTKDGVLRWGFEDRRPAPSEPPAPRSIFIGREAELAALEAELLPASGDARPVAVGALQGMPGVGKSYLADHFHAMHAASFPGGMVRLVLGRDDARSADELFGTLADRLQVRAGDEVRERLLAPRTLLHIENADSDRSAAAAAGVVARLRGCPVVVTGRVQGLGKTKGWAQIQVKPFGPADALKQLEAEHPGARPEDRAQFSKLAEKLGHLPLALSLAAAHLADGHSVEGFLDLLHRKRLEIASPDLAGARETIAATFALSLDLFAAHLGAEAPRLIPAFEALGHAPLAGFGASLGAAIAALPPLDFEALTVAAARRSMLLPVEDRKDQAHRVHPLLAELLRRRPGAEGAFDRMTEWFVERLPEQPAGQEDEQGRRWKEVQAEAGGLSEWLSRVEGDALVRVARAGTRHAIRCGPFQIWMAFCERGLAQRTDPAERSNLLWTLAYVARHAGALDRALRAAEEQAAVDRARGADRDAALAAGIRADILQARGELDEALRIRREEELPVYERLGDVRARAVTLGKVADILQARGELDEALRIRREEELPVYERLGDVHARAVTLGKVADILTARGELDEALRIRKEEELPVYERLGDVHARAVTLGQVADILKARGKLDEALRIRKEEQLPVYERLGDVRSILVARANLALIHLDRAHPADREAAADLLRLALIDAERLRIPEAETIRRWQRKHGL